MLGRHIGRLVHRAYQPMYRRDVDDAPGALLLHVRQCRRRCMEHCREIQRQDRIPLFGGKFLDRCGVLNARVVHQNVDAAHLRNGVLDHSAHRLASRKVGAIMRDPHAELGFQVGTNAFDLRRIAEPIQHDVGALPRQRGGDAKTDTAGRAGNHRDLSREHGRDSLRRRPKCRSTPRVDALALGRRLI
ncbi:hypothetical protein G6F57_016736 [Rhizopus arrhizus]|nr:hypothetical protein G6F57_016736 [Rhizopus arrhizus]